jgi:hypothetical protein
MVRSEVSPLRTISLFSGRGVDDLVRHLASLHRDDHLGQPLTKITDLRRVLRELAVGQHDLRLRERTVHQSLRGSANQFAGLQVALQTLEVPERWVLQMKSDHIVPPLDRQGDPRLYEVAVLRATRPTLAVVLLSSGEKGLQGLEDLLLVPLLPEAFEPRQQCLLDGAPELLQVDLELSQDVRAVVRQGMGRTMYRASPARYIREVPQVLDPAASPVAQLPALLDLLLGFRDPETHLREHAVRSEVEIRLGGDRFALRDGALQLLLERRHLAVAGILDGIEGGTQPLFDLTHLDVHCRFACLLRLLFCQTMLLVTDHHFAPSFERMKTTDAYSTIYWPNLQSPPVVFLSFIPYNNRNAPVAQWIEQETSKLLAVGSIPTRGTISMVHRKSSE